MSSVTNMGAMFIVRFVWAPNLQSSPPLARRSRPMPSRLSSRISSRIAYALLSTRQWAKKFNQPLSWDTSSVTKMYYLFNVRRHITPTVFVESGHSRVHMLLAPPLAPPRHHAPPPRLTPRPASYVLVSTRQRASAFNQPLNWDTSSVKTMVWMFQVRSSPCPAPNLQSSPPRVHAACAAPVPFCILFPPSNSTGRVVLQPATELQHVQRHRHGRHVSGALRACPGPPAFSRSPSRACRLRRHRPTPSHLPALTPRPASYALLSTRQLAKAFNQPLSFDTSSVTNMEVMFRVRADRALAPTNIQSGPSLRAACAAPRSHTSGPAPCTASHARLSIRQEAFAFNQPLSFDTSSVTNMGFMFDVRSARDLGPQPSVGTLPVRAACTAAAPRPLASRPAPHPALHALLSTR